MTPVCHPDLTEMLCSDGSCNRPLEQFQVYWGRIGTDNFPFDPSLIGDPQLAFMVGLTGEMDHMYRTSLAKPGGYSFTAPPATGEQHYPTTIVIQDSTWEQHLDFPKFNPALGALTGVNVDLTTYVRYQYRMENLKNSPRTLFAKAIAVVTVMPPDSTILIEGAAAVEHSHEYEAYDGLTDFAGPSGYFLDPAVSASAASAVSLVPGDPQFAQFIGSGNIAIDVTGGNSYLTTGDVAPVVAKQTILGQLGADLQISYNYTPFAGYLWFIYPVNSGWVPANFSIPMASAGDLGVVDTINGFGRATVDDGLGNLYYAHRSAVQVLGNVSVTVTIGV